MMYGISYASFFLPEDADLAHIFNLQESIFYVKYGAPTIDDPQRFVRLMDVMEEGAVTAKDLHRFMGWELANGTELFLTDGEFGILSVYTNTANCWTNSIIPTYNRGGIRMKHSYGKTLAIGLTLILLLTGVCAVAEDAQAILFADITFDMTPEEVVAAEGSAGADVSQAYEATGAQYVYNYPAEGTEPLRQVVYAFMGGQLVMYGCTVNTQVQAEEMDAAAYYDTLEAQLTETYGDTATEDSFAMTMMLAMTSVGTDDGSIIAYAIWEMDDGTLLYLSLEEDVVNYTFINTEKLFGAPV